SLTATSDSLPSLAAHHDAIELLIKNRGISITRDGISIGILFGIRSQLVSLCLSIPFFDPVNGHNLTWDDVPEQIRFNPVHTLTTASIPVANLRVLADEILYEPKSEINIHRVRDLIDQCKATDNALTEWRSTLPGSWGFMAIENKKLTIQKFRNLEFKTCPWLAQGLVYRDIWFANLHNTYFMFRALLQSIILRCVVWMTSWAGLSLDLNSEFTQAKEEILKTFQSICGSVAFLLGASPNVRLFPDLQLPFRCQTSELGPPLLIRPLFVAQSVIVAQGYQRSWVASILLSIGTSYGIGIARLIAKAKGFNGQPLFC
ncbi:uncharacterized protein A1O9_03608, partial [Exophiala aquamarina CBS 119918]